MVRLQRLQPRRNTRCTARTTDRTAVPWFAAAVLRLGTWIFSCDGWIVNSSICRLRQNFSPPVLPLELTSLDQGDALLSPQRQDESDAEDSMEEFKERA